jgi:Xaa-Pro aminopeptidase
VGGVRLEDDVLVTKTGAEVLSHLPRQAKDVETWLEGRY